MKKISLMITLLFLTSCASMGRKFEFKGPESIRPGKTRQTEIVNFYGVPFRSGYQDGDVQWTYGYYKWSLFGETITKDLVITFDSTGKVKSYNYNSSLEEGEVKMIDRKVVK